MNFFTEHSTLLIIMLLIIVVGTFFLLLGYAICRAGAIADKKTKELMVKEYLKNNKEINIEEY